MGYTVLCGLPLVAIVGTAAGGSRCCVMVPQVAVLCVGKRVAE